LLFDFCLERFSGSVGLPVNSPGFAAQSIGVQRFNALYAQNPPYIQATSMLGLLLPVIIFFIAQRVFLQGVVISGVEK
jgi:ABC-type glycerol-3-phosphate transport system permease component